MELFYECLRWVTPDNFRADWRDSRLEILEARVPKPFRLRLRSSGGHGVPEHDHEGCEDQGEDEEFDAGGVEFAGGQGFAFFAGRLSSENDVRRRVDNSIDIQLGECGFSGFPALGFRDLFDLFFEGQALAFKSLTFLFEAFLLCVDFAGISGCVEAHRTNLRRGTRGGSEWQGCRGFEGEG